MASINTFDEMGLNKKREYEAKLKREGIVAEGTVSAGNMEEEEGWVERFRKIPMVKLLRESKCVANDSKEQDLADIMTEINKHEWDKIEDFIQSELDRAREEGRREVYEAIVFDKNIPHDVTTFVAAHLWKNMRDKAKEELSKLKSKQE